MPNLTTYKKPELAVISEVKKIREYSDTDKLTIAKNIVDGLLIKLGVSGKSNSAHHVEVIRFIADNKEFTPDEFTKAFDLAIDGELKIDLFQQLNRVVMGRVMVLYKAYKIEKLRAYRSRKKTEKTISDDEQEFIMIEAVDRIEKEYKANKEITGTFVHVYDYLFTQGVLPKHTKAFKSRILKKSKEIAKSDVIKELNIDYDNSQNYELGKQLKATLENIDNNNHDSIKTISKRLVLEEYFKNL